MNNIDFNSYLEEDILFQDGIYSDMTNVSVSYPEGGYKNCFQIEDSSWWFNHRNNCICSVIKAYSNDEVFFDVGGGNGKVAKHLQDNNVRVVMIEAGKEGITNARSRGIDNLVHANLNDLNIKGSSIPSIGMFDVLEHIDDDLDCLEKIYQSLRPGGHYYLTVPAYQVLWSNEDVEAGHFRRYTMSYLTGKLKEKYFEVPYASYIFQYLPLPILLSRVLPYQLGLVKKKNVKQHVKDHEASGLIEKLTSYLHKRELKNIGNHKVIPFGGSLMIVARKPL